jgi:5-methylcytosine-specific restriction endonuclease McrA
MIDYKSYLQSALWRRTRSDYLWHVGKWCEVCHLGKATEVHHVTYKNLGNEGFADLMAVCKRCHQRIHNPANDNEPMLDFGEAASGERG